MIGSKSVSEQRIGQHKEMAGAGMKGNFGVQPFPCKSMAHPDVGMSHAALDDGARGAPPAIGGGKQRHGMQASPDHGPMGKDTFNRAGRL